MKKKSLWIGISAVLIIVVVGFIFLNTKSGDIDLGNEKNEQYHGTVGNDVEKKNSSDNECYDENGTLIESPEYDSQGDIINCYDYNGYQKGKQISYYNNGKIRTIWIVESGNFTGYYENGKIFEEGHMFKDAFNSENNKKGFILTKDGKWIQYYENGNKEFEGTYKKGTAEGKWIYYYENGSIKEYGNYVGGYKNDKWYFYDEDGNILKEGTYNEGIADGNWSYNNSGNTYLGIYENGEMIDLKGDLDAIKKDNYFNIMGELYITSLRNKFKHGKDISKDEFRAINEFFGIDYSLYYYVNNGEIILDSEEFFNHSYGIKRWDLLASYSMMNCSEDPLNPDAYLFNLDDPKLAQEIYFKNCPKGCKYSDDENVDFVCE